MIKNFLEWWRSGKPENHDSNAFEDEQQIYNEEEDYRYETTLVRDLKIISDLLGKEFPHHIADRNVNRYGEIRFRSDGFSIKEIRKAVGLKSFSVEHDFSNIGTVYWTVDKNEYEKTYETKYTSYANTIRKLTDLIERNFDNPDYFYVFCKYEDSIYIVANTLKDEYENNSDEISDDVFQKSKIIIEKTGQAILKRYRELEYIEELQKEAVSKSLINRLDDEIDFMDKFIEVQ